MFTPKWKLEICYKSGITRTVIVTEWKMATASDGTLESFSYKSKTNAPISRFMGILNIESIWVKELNWLGW